ncbi:MAG: zinc metalloprotease HtpX [Hyphomicrobiaceae bacterium]
MNYTKTALLLFVLTAIFVAMGAAVGGQGGMVIAFIVALVMNVVSLWKSDKMVLRMFGAHEVDRNTAPDLVELVHALARRAELPPPRVYVMQNPQPNAFATGRNPENSAVAVSTGLLDILNREEIAGVVAHELAHIRNRDTLTMMVAATIGGAISMLAQYLQFGMLFGNHREDRGGIGLIGSLIAMIAAPFAAMLVQTAISRSREYQADRMGAMIVGNPLWLASALEKISVRAKGVVNRPAEAVPAAAHLFIVNPLTGRGVDNMFSTHPNTENRIAELMKLAREMGISGAGSGSPAPSVEYGEVAGENAGPWSRQGAGRRSPPRGPWG